MCLGNAVHCREHRLRLAPALARLRLSQPKMASDPNLRVPQPQSHLTKPIVQSILVSQFSNINPL
jgi:hypothetical protein